jgi:predicted dehydrogenase
MIAVIGCGYWGKNLIRNFSELNALKAVCDQNGQVAQQYAETYAVQADHFEAILRNPTIEGVAIAVSPRFNVELSLRALQAGKHVFVEKPHAYTTEDAAQLDQVCSQTDRIFMVGHLLLYHPAYLRTKELLNQGAIGKLKEIRCFRHGLGRVREEFNVLWELAPHDVSLILDLNPFPVETLQAIGSCCLTEREDIVRARYVFSNGVTAQISCSWTDPMRQQKLVLQGTKGFLVFDDTKPWAEKVHLIQFVEDMDIHDINNLNYTIGPIDLKQEEVLKRECRHFLDCIEGKATPQSGLAQASPVFDLLMRTQQQITDNR